MPATLIISKDEVASSATLKKNATQVKTPEQIAVAALDLLALQGKVRPPNGPGRGNTPASQVFPLFERLLPDEPVAVDIEMVEYHIDGMVHPDFKANGKENEKAGYDRWAHRIGVICASNTIGEVILHVFARYQEDPNVQTKIPFGFGVKPQYLLPQNGAVDASIVEAWCQKIFAGREVVLHGGSQDLKCFFNLGQKGISPFSGATTLTDTQHMYRQAKLSDLVSENLGRAIQVGGHEVVEDTVATMKLRQLRRPFDRVAAQKAFNALPEADKKAYLATGPNIAHHLYQDNIFPGMPETAKAKILEDRRRKALRSTRGGRGGRGGGKAGHSRK